MLAVAVSLWAYPHLPERVPTHWDLGGNVNSHSSRFFAVALMPGLVVALGTQLGRFDKNFFIGVRTPLTLASGEVWKRTNDLTGRIMIVGGLLLMAVSSFGRLATAVLFALVLVMVVVSLGYWYALYLRIEGFRSDDAVEVSPVRQSGPLRQVIEKQASSGYLAGEGTHDGCVAE